MCFTHGEQHKFSYFMRTLPGLEQFLKPLDDVIMHKFLPALFGSVISETERCLLALPVQEGGIGVPIFSEKASVALEASTILTGPLQASLVSQDTSLPPADAVQGAKAASRQLLTDSVKRKSAEVFTGLSVSDQRLVEQSKEKGLQIG